MSLTYLQGSFTPKSARYYESNDYFLYQGETFHGHLSILNYDEEPSGAFDVDLYLSSDGIIDENDYYLGTHNVANGIPGKDSFRPAMYYGFNNIYPMTLPSKDSDFWTDTERYYLGVVIEPNKAILESDFENNPDLDFFIEEFPNPIKIRETDLPVVSFTQNDSTLKIDLTETAPEGGFTFNYKNIAKEDYISELGNPYENEDYHTRLYYGDRAYDSELNRLYVTGGSYHDLTSYKYYDTAGGHYDPFEDKYHNADGSYYDTDKKLLYDLNGNVSELIDNSAEYIDSVVSPRHYLPTGGYISLISGVFYDARGGYIDETTEQYFFKEGDNGLGTAGYDTIDLKGEWGFEITGTRTLSRIATPNLDYDIVPSENIQNITDSTITIAPGETSAKIDFNFHSDTVFDPSEVIEFELLEDNERRYNVGHFALHRFQVIESSLADLKNPRLGDFNFSVDRNARPGTTIGHVNFSDPQGDELIYSLVGGGNELDDLIDGERYLKPQYPYTNIDPNLELIETSNQDLDGDGIHPFSIDATTGAISLTDFDDLDREAVNNVAPEDYSQLYNSGYYQLFVRVADEVSIEENFLYSYLSPYQTSIVNVQVVDLPTTSGDDDVVGTLDNDIIRGKGGDDTINGLAGNDTINSGMNSDRIAGGGGRDLLMGSAGDDTLNGGIGYDTLNGGTGHDVLFGLYGDDTLNGGEGNDVLRGGAGIDRLVGDAGSDIFVLDLNSGQDIIVDFEDGADLLRLPIDMSFADLNITNASVYTATIIKDSHSDLVIAVLPGIDAESIAQTDFSE